MGPGPTRVSLLCYFAGATFVAFLLALALSWRETDGGLYYADSYYHQLNSYTTSSLWCSYVILGDTGRWYLVHDSSSHSRLTFSNGCCFHSGSHAKDNRTILAIFPLNLSIPYDQIVNLRAEGKLVSY